MKNYDDMTHVEGVVEIELNGSCGRMKLLNCKSAKTVLERGK